MYGPVQAQNDEVGLQRMRRQQNLFACDTELDRKEYVKELNNSDLSRTPMNRKEMILHHREKARMLASIAYEKVISNEIDYITSKEAEDFFRVDDYVTGVARKEKLTRIINTYGDDPELSKAIKILSERIRKI